MKKLTDYLLGAFLTDGIMVLLTILQIGQGFGQTLTDNSRFDQLVLRLDTVQSVADRRKLAEDFAELAETEKSQWKPYYYAAFCLTRAALEETERGNIDPFCAQATSWLDAAESLRADPSEVAVLRAMILYAKIPVNFMLRAATNLERGQRELERALELNPDNPRAYLVLGQRALRAPEGFGGSTTAALAYLEKALVLFQKQASEEKPGVHWGRTTAQQLAELCRTKLASRR